MQRNSTSMGAFHPAFFMMLVYVISIVLAFFVCRMIYFSTHPSDDVAEGMPKDVPLTALR